MYQYKSLPKASAQEFERAPRDRIVPDDEKPGEPAELDLADAARLQEKRDKKTANYGSGRRR